MAYELLDSVNYPHELRQLERSQLPRLANELRQFLLESVSQTGGHLSSNLGTVELTIALHYVFDTPHDRLVWDVGHQTYGHKVLTGRREGMKKLRMWGGISGFPRREESEYDTFGTAHSSTSISAALGMAVGSKLRGERRNVVIVWRVRADVRRHTDADRDDDHGRRVLHSRREPVCERRDWAAAGAIVPRSDLRPRLIRWRRPDEVARDELRGGGSVMLQKPLHMRDAKPQLQAVPRESAFVRGTRACQKFAIGALSLVALAFVFGLAWGALRAGIILAERWLMP